MGVLCLFVHTVMIALALFYLALPRFTIGPQRSRHPLNQSDPENKTICDLFTRSAFRWSVVVLYVSFGLTTLDRNAP